MKKLLSIFILLMTSSLLYGQLLIKPIKKKEERLNNSQLSQSQNVAPASLPFWDDFSISKDSVDNIRIWGSDTTSQWDYERSKHVYVNTTLAINPPTYKVVTFDGLDGNGAFHVENELRLADQLRSDTIDLSSYEENDNIYISFYWQAGGNVEKPDEGDSLRLQFFNPNDSLDSSPWTTIWSMEGDEQLQDSIFTQEIRQVKEAFLTDEFIFRFQSFGDLNGPFDAWHIDWIYLNSGRSEDEINTGYRDRAFSGQFTSIFSPFTSIPANQLRANLDDYIGDQSILISNLDFTNPQPLSYRHEIIDIESSSILYLNDEEEIVPLLLENTIQEVPLDNIDFTSFPIGDSIILRSTINILTSKDSILTGDIDLKINDLVSAEYLLHDYYAYDDGSAEFAAGTNVLGGQIAVKFWLEEEDTLTHVAFHFPNISPSSDGKPITLKILKRLDDEFPLRTQQINAESSGSINGFTSFALKRPLVLSDTFYIAYEQSSNEYIGIGFDRSNPDASEFIFENNGDEWEQNVRLKGALMIRPIFDEVGEFALGNHESQKLVIFPNPTDGFLSIKGSYTDIVVLDIAGKILLQEKAQDRHDLSSLEVGIYLLKVRQTDGERTYKIIKK